MAEWESIGRVADSANGGDDGIVARVWRDTRERLAEFARYGGGECEGVGDSGPGRLCEVIV